MAKHEKTKWEEQNLASEDYQHLLNSFRVEFYPDYIAVDGACPICKGDISTKSPKRFQAPNGNRDVVGQGNSSPVHWEVIVECNCGQHHQGQPRGSNGCGMALKIGVVDA